MKATSNFSDSFTADDIRKNRERFSARHMDVNSNIDWNGAFAETEKGAAIVRAEIERIKKGRKCVVT
jgi:hypothetical protein